MSVLYSKIQPLIYTNEEFSDAFERLVVSSDSFKIASGYISEESLIELKSMLDSYKTDGRSKKCDLIIGMHARDGFTKPQYDAAKNLAEYLRTNNLGEVRICTSFKFHGKVYSFYCENSPIATIVGSSNLSNIIDSRQWEVDKVLTDAESMKSLGQLHEDLAAKATKKILEWKVPEKFLENQDLLAGRVGVEKATLIEMEKANLQKTKVSFSIPLKTELKSNLNAFFGKGRLSTSTGAIRPRPWYEIELIVSKSITTLKGYPKAGTIFNVITDDGWKFRCKISGQNDKNLRSYDDLKTLGRWIKGRLESAGALKVGELITDEMLQKYGRNNLSLTQTENPEVWILDFSV